jgi:hypothetical protein
MLINAKTLKGYQLDGRDGVVGKVKEFYVDDLLWTVRNLDSNCGKRPVISPNKGLSAVFLFNAKIGITFIGQL